MIIEKKKTSVGRSSTPRVIRWKWDRKLIDATALAMTSPLPAELEAARTGTTLAPRSAEQARLPDVPTTAGGPQGQVVRKFDYTHLGDAGARTFAALVADGLARAVPALRTQLLP